ncbi:hypothetical protein FSP39_019792 [Pinctada imbricata]|uniref:KY-like immunoglobulin-like domain-containing protein n=2 Tax=Pinctada TaxID=50425 RepID=A0AA89C5T3_PINIB|nr:hypothetical protein FSP39_019792 [Pinctada imbricata]
MANYGRPEMPEGYLGPQERFSELGLSVLSHDQPEIIARENHLEIKLKARNHVKVTHQLVVCKNEHDFSEYVFTQHKDGVIHLLVHMPEAPEWYKLQIYALPASDPSKSLPNVYNYLIHCTRSMLPVYPFPKQYAQWKDGCYLYEPLVVNEHTKLTNIKWHVHVPRAKQVAVVADGSEWFHLESKGGPVYQGSCSLDHLRGKDKKVTLNANFDTAEENKFSTLLEYHIK